MEKFFAWLGLVRIEHAIMSMLAVLVGIFVSLRQAYFDSGAIFEAGNLLPAAFELSQKIPNIFILALATPFFINIASFALNDYLDIETDRHNMRKDRPLAAGKLNPKIALWTAAVGYIFGIISAWLINFYAGLIATIFAILSIAYNYKLKDLPVVGNAYIALSMAIAFPFGSVSIGVPITKLPSIILLLSIGAFLAGMSRELFKSVQDMHGDKKARGSKHLPILIGARPSLVMAGFFAVGYTICIAWLASLYPWPQLPLFFIGASGVLYALIAIGGFFGPSLHSAHLEGVRKVSLAALVLALVGIILAIA
jgi:4-hydroxybenzoate polyprenyltransferase